MPAPFQHSGLSTFMGSWPVIPSYISGTAIFDPRVLEEHAVILGAKRETSAGFNVAGKTMYLWIDGQLVSFRKTINFNSYSDPYTLDQVVTEINTDALTTVAYNDNGFLRLQSPSSGADGYLKLGTYNDPDVFYELGLFSGIEAYGGQLKQAKNIDPDRQVALPGQFAISDGESFTADVINRALHQLAVNSDRSEGVIGRKRVAKQEVNIISSYVPTGTPSEEGVQFSGGVQVYTGGTQTLSALESLFVVLTSDGREFIKKVTTVLTTDTVTFTNADGRQIATDSGGNFLATDETDEIFVQSSSGSLPAALQGVPMKILEVQSANIAVIQPIDPDTGAVELFTTGGVSADRINYSDKRCRVDEIRTSQSGSRVEGVNEQVSPSAGSHVPTRIDLNNRIVVSGATFVSDGVQVGDQVVWSGYTLTNPYSNSGTYRVGQVVDEETIEVVSEDWGPAFLNPDMTTPGTLVVNTDGLFYQDPFVHFLPEASGGAIPEAGDYIKILYLGMTNIRSATDDPAVFASGGVRYQQEADDTVQKAILAIIGPSATSINEYLHNDARNSMENIDYRLDFEHYPSDTLDAGTGDEARQGRHKDIRPDTINMWGEIAGETFTVRGATADGANAVKMAFRDEADNLRFDVTASGKVNITVTAAAVAAGYSRYQITDDSAVVRYRVAANGLIGSYADYGNDDTYVEIGAGVDSGPGVGRAIVNIVGEATATAGAQLHLQANSASGSSQEIEYAWVVDYDGGDPHMRLEVIQDGAGGSMAELLRFHPQSGDVEIQNGIIVSELRSLYDEDLTIAAAIPAGSTAGRSVSVTASNAGTAGSDINGGLVTIEGGASEGDGYSYIDLKVATGGLGTGSDQRLAERYMLIDGATGTVKLSKDLDLNGSDITNLRSLPGEITVGAFSVSDPGNDEVTVIGAETEFNGVTIPDASVTTGTIMHVIAWGEVGAISGSSQLDVRIALDGNEAGIVTVATAAGTDYWYIEADIVFVTDTTFRSNYKGVISATGTSKTYDWGQAFSGPTSGDIRVAVTGEFTGGTSVQANMQGMVVYIS